MTKEEFANLKPGTIVQNPRGELLKITESISFKGFVRFIHLKDSRLNIKDKTDNPNYFVKVIEDGNEQRL